MLRIFLALIALTLWSVGADAQQWLPGGQGIPIACAYTSSPPTVASGGFIFAQCDTNGKLITSGGGGSFTWPGTATVTNYGTAPTGTVPAVNAYVTGGVTSNGSVSSTGSAVPASATYVGITSSGNLTGWTGAVSQGTAASTSGAWPAYMTYSLSGTPTLAPGTTYGIDTDINASSTLYSVLTAAVPGVAESAVDPTAAADAANANLRTDSYGNLVTAPYAPSGLQWTSSSGATTGTSMTFSGSSKSAYYTYITDSACGRTDAGTSAIIITFNDAAATIIVLPDSGGGGGNNKSWTTPLKISSSTNTAVTGTVSSGVTSTYCTLSGFFKKT